MLIKKQCTSLLAQFVVGILKAMVTARGFIAHVRAMGKPGGLRMNKEQAVIHYKTAMVFFNKLLADGVITTEELTKIDTILLKKYGLSLGSIYR
jgi:hypothetical protein